MHAPTREGISCHGSGGNGRSNRGITLKKFASFRIFNAVLALGVAVGIAAHAQSSLLALPTWFRAVWKQALGTPTESTIKPGTPPATIPQYFENSDATGRIATYQPLGATTTAGNAFF